MTTNTTLTIAAVIKSVITRFFVVKGTYVSDASMPQLFGKASFKRMRYLVFVIIISLTMFYLGKSSFRNISLILRAAFDIKVFHTTINNWCSNFAPLFDNMRLKLLSMLDLFSDEWHTDETVVNINGKKHYIWFIINSETRFVLGFNLSPYRIAHRLILCLAIVSNRYSAYKAPVKSILPDAKHIRLKALKTTFPTILLSA